MKKTNCEECINYFYDDDAECYTCAIDLDEDEMFLFMRGSFSACPSTIAAAMIIPLSANKFEGYFWFLIDSNTFLC